MRLLLAAALLLLGLVCVWAREEAYLFLWAARVRCRAAFGASEFGLVGVGSTLWDPALTVQHFGFTDVAVPEADAAPRDLDELGFRMAIPVALSQAMYDALSTSYSTNCEFQETLLMRTWFVPQFFGSFPPVPENEEEEQRADAGDGEAPTQPEALALATYQLANMVQSTELARCPSTDAPRGWAATQPIICFPALGGPDASERMFTGGVSGSGEASVGEDMPTDVWEGLLRKVQEMSLSWQEMNGVHPSHRLSLVPVPFVIPPRAGFGGAEHHALNMGSMWPEYCSDYDDAWDCSDEAAYSLLQDSKWVD
jgi:hypothetical protein